MHCLDVRRMEAMRLVRLCPRSRQNTYSSRQDYLPCQQPSRFNAKADQPKSGSPYFATSLNPVLEKNRNNYGSETVDFGGPVDKDSASDEVFTGADDKVIGGLGDDYIDGGSGNDYLTGHGGNDVIDGGDGNDQLNGDGILKPGFYQTLAETQNGNDVLDGGAGDDQLIGGGKDDGLFGGLGKDKLWGDDATEADLGGQYHGSSNVLATGWMANETAWKVAA